MPCQSAAISASNCGVPDAGSTAVWGKVPGSVVVVVVVAVRSWSGSWSSWCRAAAVAVALAGGAVRARGPDGDGRTT